ncbi:MAG: ABC transporter substrate-binding protein, partial [Anaerolineales bacterium]
MKKITWMVQALIVLALLLTGCVGQGAGVNQPVTLRVGWLGFPDTLNPAYAFLSEAYSMFDLIYSTLAVESPTGEYVPGLATEWSVSDDGLTWTFKLRQGVKWHNGEPLTAEQIAWNLNAFINNPDGWVTNSSYVIGFVEARVVDASTLVIETEYPISNMDYRVSYLYIVYPPDFEGYTTPEDLQNFSNFSPIGSGAFKIARLDKDQRVIVLETNRDFYEGAAKIDEIIYQ